MYSSEFSVSDEYPSDRIYGGIKCHGMVDIIFWKENFTSIESILGYFDYNINQFILERDITGKIVGTSWEGILKYGELQQLRDTEISNTRFKNTIMLAKEVGWTVKQEIQEVPWGGVQ